MAEKLVSPGVFTRENDLSFIAQGVGEIGAAIVGPFKQGPAFKPTIITTQSELTDVFGAADGTYYTELTAQNYLREAGVVTICRVAGTTGYTEQSPGLLTITADGSVKTISVSGSATGSGYTNGTAPIIFSGFTATTQPTASATIVGGAVSAITLTNIGQNGDYNTSFIINKCQNKINNEINSKNQWLYFMEIIQNIKGKEIITLKGMIDKKKQVVLKIQNYQLGEKEFDIQEKLSNYNGFIKFYCYFNCNINPKFYNGTYIKGNKIDNKLCNSKGNKMWINIMQYYSNGSFEDKLLTLNYNELSTIVKSIIINYFNAFLQENFIHGDFEPKNIILNNNNEPLIIDFENSNFTGNIMSFWRDLDRFFYIIQRYIKFNLNNFIRENIIMHMAFNKKPTEDIIVLLLNNFQNIIIQ